MSKHGRDIRCACGATVPVNRANLKKRGLPGGFKCRKCEAADLKERQARKQRAK